MKIAIDLTALADNFSGIERMALSVTEELLQLDVKNQYQLFFKEKIHEKFQKFIEEDRIEIVVLPRKNKLWFSQVTLRNALQRSDADIFVFLAFPAPFFLHGKKIVNTIHDVGYWDCPETMPTKMVLYFRLMAWRAGKASWKIITISEFSKRRIQQHLKNSADKIKVIYLGVSPGMYETQDGDWEQIRAKYHLPEHYIMCLSTLEPRKNMALLAKAYMEIPAEKLRGCDLVLAGRRGWKMDEFLNELSEEERKRICITGYVDDANLPALYRHAEVFVFPSIYEGFGIPPLEAMAAGCPVICSDIDAHREILGEMAVYFRSNDKEDLQRTLIGCMNGDIPVPSSDSLIQYSRKYSYQKAAKELQEILKENKGE